MQGPPFKPPLPFPPIMSGGKKVTESLFLAPLPSPLSPPLIRILGSCSYPFALLYTYHDKSLFQGKISISILRDWMVEGSCAAYDTNA